MLEIYLIITINIEGFWQYVVANINLLVPNMKHFWQQFIPIILIEMFFNKSPILQLIEEVFTQVL